MWLKSHTFDTFENLCRLLSVSLPQYPPAGGRDHSSFGERFLIVFKKSKGFKFCIIVRIYNCLNERIIDQPITNAEHKQYPPKREDLFS
jgi:hypothetical protein